ncbi:MAG: non-canonical purine NTP pyrophosphatase [Chlamydiae bacterium CG10_big_fil_rev_8_21_14_0_10_42_34]|nr:MAG: non-canonical purine NTP pyrophosphatase [Chlamydiae bacterium CG10_big_fil_rev_8_21_14_0_10_42_34]
MSSSNNHSSFQLELVIASTNMHKVREFKTMLKPIAQFDLRSLHDFPDYVPPEETGDTFEENAKLKAEHAAKTLNKWVIADDSGLVVPALNGAPGVLSARYAGNDATDLENRKKLLDEIQYLMEEDRQAFFECAIALASPEGLKKCVKGTCEGVLLNQDRGGGGFGYDPLFIKHGYNKTFAELSESIKNRISHRRKALDKIALSLESLMST